MKIFISWSGNDSKAIAEYLKKWIEQIIQAAEPWISVDIEKGKKWNSEISEKLENSKVGIFCVTKENLNSPWILFEAGAISKTEDSYVCTFLIDLNPTDLTGPLSLFQATKFNKEDIFKLLVTINQSISNSGGKGLSMETLKDLFEIFYPQLEEKVKSIIENKKGAKKGGEEIRSERELLEESVQILRQLKQSKLENPIEKEAKELLNFYAEKYAKMVGEIKYYHAGTDEHIVEFMSRIQENPLLLKAYGGKAGLRNKVKSEFDGLPF
ncbi:toll/interleukin-1 receptor domain-containing protein [Flavicella sediminum]|uniref:toll/interleukin-1 receptor domain-containing protein n=1 Tax=Flavicella sediminum TaxID=2585141 RepID=UPI00111D589D|nr:toll/interleukin-1 receptor domain-containing protein [Flavicella sediminum]